MQNISYMQNISSKCKNFFIIIIIIYSYIVIYFLQSIVTIVSLIVETILHLFLLYVYIIL